MCLRGGESVVAGPVDGVDRGHDHEAAVGPPPGRQLKYRVFIKYCVP